MDITSISIADLFSIEDNEFSPYSPVDSESSFSSVPSTTLILPKPSISSISSKISEASVSSKASTSSVSSKASVTSNVSVSSVSSEASNSSKASVSSKASKSSITTKFSSSSKTLVASRVSKVIKDTLSTKASKLSITTNASKISKTLKKPISSLSLKSSKLSKDNSKPPKTLLQKIGLFLESIIYVVLVFLVIYAFINILLYSYEKNELKFYEYGMKLDVNYHNLDVGIDGEQNEPTIVLLPELGTPSPIIYYKPIVDVLSDKYKVITMEPLGYGLSDMVDDARTIDNIVSELHAGIKNLGIEKYYLMGHSVGGLYSLYWSNQYANEVLGFIGLDTIVPGAEERVKSMPNTMKKFSIMNHFGVERMVSLFNSNRLFLPLNSSYHFDEEDTKMFRIITLQKGYNKTQRKEVNAVLDNLDVVKAMKFPEDCPVINFISSENTKQYPNWKKLHIEIGNESISNEVIEITGNNANFAFDQRETISNKIKSWIK